VLLLGGVLGRLPPWGDQAGMTWHAEP